MVHNALVVLMVITWDLINVILVPNTVNYVLQITIVKYVFQDILLKMEYVLVVILLVKHVIRVKLNVLHAMSEDI